VVVFLHPSSAGMHSFTLFIFFFIHDLHIYQWYESCPGEKTAIESRERENKVCFILPGFLYLLFSFPGGMQALFEVKDCRQSTTVHNENTKIRQYFIAAEEIIWNYGPSAMNHFTGEELIADR